MMALRFVYYCFLLKTNQNFNLQTTGLLLLLPNSVIHYNIALNTGCKSGTHSDRYRKLINDLVDA